MNQQMDNQLPEGWETTLLENVTIILDSMRIPINNEERKRRIEGKDDSELYPYYGATGEVGKIDGYLFDEELIALGEDGVPFLDAKKNKAYMLNGKTWVNNHAHVLKANPTFCTNKYILYFLNQFNYQDYVNGGTRLKLTQANMRRIPIPLPPLAEQHYLADKLDSLLARIQTLSDQLAAVPALLKQFRQSVLADAVSGKLTVKWREETGNNDEWCSYLLKDITTKIGSGSTPKGGNSVYKTSGIPFVRSLNIYSDYIKYDDLAFIDMEQAKKLANVEIQENDVLLNITGASIGRVNIAPQAFVGGRVNQHVAIIRVKAEIAIAKYLHLLLASPEVQKWVHGENYGATRQALTKNMIEMLVVQLPSIAEQTEIVRRVEALFALADNIEQQSRAAAERVALLTQSVLAKAFRGELSEQWRREHPDLISGDNSAAALLARIQAERAATGKKSRRA